MFDDLFSIHLMITIGPCPAASFTIIPFSRLNRHICLPNWNITSSLGRTVAFLAYHCKNGVSTERWICSPVLVFFILIPSTAQKPVLTAHSRSEGVRRSEAPPKLNQFPSIRPSAGLAQPPPENEAFVVMDLRSILVTAER